MDKPDKGAEHVAAVLHRRDPLSVGTDIGVNFNALLLSTKLGANESFRNFEMRV